MKPHVLHRSLMLVALLSLAGAACARGGTESEAEPRPDDSPVRVEVSNNFALPVEIYAVGSGITRRLGTVHPGMNAQFPIPQSLLGGGGVELQARPTTGDQPFRSDPILLAPGTIVQFMIAPQLFSSTINLRQ